MGTAPRSNICKPVNDLSFYFDCPLKEFLGTNPELEIVIVLLINDHLLFRLGVCSLTYDDVFLSLVVSVASWFNGHRVSP
jgi:hypothetical protein